MEELPKDADGEIKLDVFCIPAMEWLKTNEPEMHKRALELSMKEIQNRGFVTFDLQREIIEYVEKARKAVTQK